jgi:hypothetical protein
MCVDCSRCVFGRCDCSVCTTAVIGIVVYQNGDTALLLACYSGQLAVARWLVTNAGSNARSERNNVR